MQLQPQFVLGAGGHTREFGGTQCAAGEPHQDDDRILDLDRQTSRGILWGTALADEGLGQRAHALHVSGQPAHQVQQVRAQVHQHAAADDLAPQPPFQWPIGVDVARVQVRAAHVKDPTRKVVGNQFAGA